MYFSTHQCTGCADIKAPSDFLISSISRKRSSKCRSCRNKKARDQYKDPKVKELFRNRQLRYEFGITLEDYNKMFTNQQGCCLTCKRHQSSLSKVLVVDHDHTSGEVRGLLCDYCNRLLGNYENKPELFKEFDTYLNRSNIRLVKVS